MACSPTALTAAVGNPPMRHIVRLSLAALALPVVLSISRGPRCPPFPSLRHGRSAIGTWATGMSSASIPTRLEKDAWNAMESYSLDSDGTINTTFTYSKGGFDGKPKEIHRARVREGRATTPCGACSSSGRSRPTIASPGSRTTTAALSWRARSATTCGSWRAAQIPDADDSKTSSSRGALGYDVSKIRKVPQKKRARRRTDVSDAARSRPAFEDLGTSASQPIAMMCTP